MYEGTRMFTLLFYAFALSDTGKLVAIQTAGIISQDRTA